MIRSAFLLAIAVTPAFGQTPALQINISDLIQGYVSVGAIVVSRGHLAYTDGRVRINPNMPSAMWPAVVDITNLPSSIRERLRTQCAAISITSGGCPAKVKGEVQQIDGRPGLIATEIEFL